MLTRGNYESFNCCESCYLRGRDPTSARGRPGRINSQVSQNPVKRGSDTNKWVTCELVDAVVFWYLSCEVSVQLCNALLTSFFFAIHLQQIPSFQAAYLLYSFLLHMILHERCFPPRVLRSLVHVRGQVLFFVRKKRAPKSERGGSSNSPRSLKIEFLT